MQDVRELTSQDDETNDKNDRQKHDADEIVDELIVLPHAHGTDSTRAASLPQG
jgi:hypothetical protein